MLHGQFVFEFQVQQDISLNREGAASAAFASHSELGIRQHTEGLWSI